MGVPAGQSTSYLIGLGVALLIILVRNMRPRRLRIETLWVFPAIYIVLLGVVLYSAPPPLTPIGIGLLALGGVIGAAIGWQRGRFTAIHIHPETHDLTAQQSVIGLIFIYGIFALRYFGRDFLEANAAQLHLPVAAAIDAFFVLAIVMLATQRLELWLRASKLLAEARAGGGANRTT